MLKSDSNKQPPQSFPKTITTCREAVKKGNKVFGAAILKLSDLSLVAVGTNTEMECPLWHGEVKKPIVVQDRREGGGGGGQS